MQFLVDNGEKKVSDKANKPLHIERAYQILIDKKLIVHEVDHTQIEEGKNLLQFVKSADLIIETIEESYTEDDDEEISI